MRKSFSKESAMGKFDQRLFAIYVRIESIEWKNENTRGDMEKLKTYANGYMDYDFGYNTNFCLNVTALN